MQGIFLLCRFTSPNIGDQDQLQKKISQNHKQNKTKQSLTLGKSLLERELIVDQRMDSLCLTAGYP